MDFSEFYQQVQEQIAEIYRKLKHNHDDLTFTPDIRPFFDIRAYGAVSGAADNCAAIQAAADAAAAYGFGASCGVLYIPFDGNDQYLVGSPGVTISTPIYFEGGAIVKSMSGDFDLFTWTPSSGHWIRGDGLLDGGGHGGNTLVVNNAGDVFLDGVQISNNFGFGGTQGDAIQLNTCEGVVIGSHMTIQGGVAGVHLVDSNYCIIGGILRQNTDGVYYSGSSHHNLLDRAQIHGNSGWGVREEADSACDYNICGGVSYASNSSGNASLIGAHSSCGQPAGAEGLEINISVWGNDSSVPGDGTDNKLPLGSFLDFQNGITLSSGRVTIETAGRYMVSFDEKFDPAEDSGYVWGEVQFGEPGSPDVFGGWLIDTEKVNGEPATSDFIFLNNSKEFELIVGDQMELYTRISNGPGTAGSVHGNLCVSYIGPTSRTESMFS